MTVVQWSTDCDGIKHNGIGSNYCVLLLCVRVPVYQSVYLAVYIPYLFFYICLAIISVIVSIYLLTYLHVLFAHFCIFLCVVFFFIQQANVLSEYSLACLRLLRWHRQINALVELCDSQALWNSQNQWFVPIPQQELHSTLCLLHPALSTPWKEQSYADWFMYQQKALSSRAVRLLYGLNHPLLYIHVFVLEVNDTMEERRRRQHSKSISPGV